MSNDNGSTPEPEKLDESGDQSDEQTSEASVTGAETDSAETDSAETETGTAETPTKAAGGVRRHAVAILLAAALVLSAGLTGWLYFTQYRADQQTDAAVRDTALEAAKTGTVALLSYSPETLDEDFQRAKTHLTGEFLDYYTDFTQKVVAPAAEQKSVNTEAKVILGAVSDLQPEAAEVLLFINQTTTSQENPDGAFAASSVKVGMKKIDDNWLIASFDPV
ncbi:MAG: hypothetical protein SW019_21850 [Actinomycetota bacterium]|nr:hypothetical protein [Actinomycetota bacterium]